MQTGAHPLSLPKRELLDLVRVQDHPHEWWVTVDGRPVIGFAGDQARSRAERYFLELAAICGGGTPRDPVGSH
jgi:hypothetical protein